MRRTGPPDITIESFINEDLRKQLKDLKDQVDGVTGKKTSVSIPEFGSLVSERADRKGVYPTFLFYIPTHTFGLTCYLVKKSDWDTAGTTRKSWVRYSWFDEITDDDRDNGTFTGDWKKPPLEFDTTYYVVFLKAYDILEEVFATNPEKTSALPGNGTPGSGTHLFEWTTRKVFPAVPPAPDSADILSNGPYLDDGINGNAKLEFRLWASADHSAFVEDLDILDGAVWLLPFEHDGSGNKIITATTNAQRYDTEAEYETAIEYDVPTSKHRAIKVIVTLPLGKKFRWYRNMLVNPAGKGKSVLSYADPPTNTIPAGVDFWAGGKVADSDADIPEPTITVIDQIDSKHSEIQIDFTQPSTAILLKRLWVEISYDGGTTWKVVYKNGLRDEENFDLPGAHSVKTTIKHKVDFEQIVYKLRATLVGIGRVGADQHSPFKITATPTSFTPTYGPPTAIPGIPASGDATRVINSDTEEPDERVTVTLRSFTDIGGGLPSTTPMSFRDGHVTQAHAVLVNGAGTEKFRIGGSIDNNTATTAVFSGLVPLGETLYWKKTIFANGDGRTISTAAGSGAPVNSSIARATADVDVPVPSFQSITQIDNKHTKLDIRFTQPATPIYLKKLLVEESLDNGATWGREKELGLKSEEGYHTTGIHDAIVLIKHPANQSQLLFRVQVLAVGGWKSAWVNSTGQTTGPDAGAATPGALATPTITTNTVDGDVERGQARIVATITPASGTFAANNITQVSLIIVKRTSGGVPDSTDKQTITKVLSTEELATSTCDLEFFETIGQRYRITKAVAINGDKRNQLGSLTVDFTAGTFLTDGTCPAPSFVSQPAADGNKIANFTIRLTNNATPVVFKSLRVEVSYGGGTFRNIEGSPIGLKHDDTLNAASGVRDFVISCKRKPGFTLDVRAFATMVGGVTSSTTNATQLAASADDRSQLTSAPGTTVTPSLDWSLTGNRVQGRWDKPTGNIDALLGYYAVFTDNAGTTFMIPDGSSRGSTDTEANCERFVTDTSFGTRAKKQQMTFSFSSGVKLKVTPVWQVNGTATRGTASSSSLLTFGSEILTDLRDAVRVVDVSTLMGAPENLLYNGDCGYSTATATDCKRWRTWDKTSAIINANCPPISTTGTDLHWDQTNHRLVWDGTGHAIVQQVRTLLPGDYYSLSFMIQGVGTFVSPFPIITVGLYLQNSTTNQIETSTTILSGPPGTSYNMIGCVIRLATGASTSLPSWLALTCSNTTLSGTKYLVLDRFMLVRGKQPYAFVNADSDFGASGGNDFDVSTPAAIAAPDVGDGTAGSQGGYFPPGSGGPFSIL